MAHKKKNGSWAGNRDQHQGPDARRAATERRKSDPNWVHQGKNTKQPPKPTQKGKDKGSYYDNYGGD